MKNTEIIEVVENLRNACTSLMGEVVGRSATDWGLVNDSMVKGSKVITELKEPITVIGADKKPSTRAALPDTQDQEAINRVLEEVSQSLEQWEESSSVKGEEQEHERYEQHKAGFDRVAPTIARSAILRESAQQVVTMFQSTKIKRVGLANAILCMTRVLTQIEQETPSV